MLNHPDASKPLPLLPCACANLRRAARVVSRIYSEEMAPTGLQMSQYTLLMVLDYSPNLNQSALADGLGMDQTTLTRTLSLMLKQGFIRVQPGEDRRQRLYQLTPKGAKSLKAGLPYWEKAQARLKSSLGETKWDTMRGFVHELTALSLKS
ncbi:MAG TPA: MarR family transcriptional regulator [bacterium]|nr:MarR family transcriptional regulator [bacterium]